MVNPENRQAISNPDGIAAQYRDSSKLSQRANIHKYSTASIGWFDWIARQARLPTGATVLEVGCGPGRLWTADALPADLALTLTDMSEGMVTEALERVRGLGRYRAVEGRRADVAALPFAANSFDAVLACHMLYHTPDPDAALDEMIRVLRPGGVLVVTTNGHDNMSEMYALAQAVWGSPAVDPGGAAFGIEAAAEALEARLQSTSVAISRDTLRVSDGEAIVGALTSYPPGETASDSQLAHLRSLIGKTMAEHGGIFAISKRVGLVRGLKG